MKVEEFDYDLPEELIAQTPAEKRDESRLMVLNKETGELDEGIFKEIVNYLEPGDVMVFNDSRVIPARLFGEKVPTGTSIEVLLLTEIENGVWEVLVKPGKRVKMGTELSFGGGRLKGKAIDKTEFGGRIMEFSYNGEFQKLLDELGELPLPPYINRKLDRPERYQTVYARERGSVAAPTAGLHFTPELLDKIRNMGVKTVYLTLHVGLGTFRPVKVDVVEEHNMHAEYYELSAEAAASINRCREEGKRVIAVGTTATRTLESIGSSDGLVRPEKGWTDIFIYPGYRFKVIDSLITNFHLPRSTLLMLISAFAGKNNVLRAYERAVKERYRFFSLGDAMFIT